MIFLQLRKKKLFLNRAFHNQGIYRYLAHFAYIFGNSIYTNKEKNCVSILKEEKYNTINPVVYNNYYSIFEKNIKRAKKKTLSGNVKDYILADRVLFESFFLKSSFLEIVNYTHVNNLDYSYSDFVSFLDQDKKYIDYNEVSDFVLYEIEKYFKTNSFQKIEFHQEKSPLEAFKKVGLNASIDYFNFTDQTPNVLFTDILNPTKQDVVIAIQKIFEKLHEEILYKCNLFNQIITCITTIHFIGQRSSCTIHY
jgi:hypothetical protein